MFAYVSLVILASRGRAVQLTSCDVDEMAARAMEGGSEGGVDVSAGTTRADVVQHSLWSGGGELLIPVVEKLCAPWVGAPGCVLHWAASGT